MTSPLSHLSNTELLSALKSLESSPSAGYLQSLATALGIIPEMATQAHHPRQAEFLALDDEEVMFGGAVGGGKTEALLRWLQQGVRYPGFSGLFLRRTFTQLEGSPTTPVERSWRFFAPLGGRFNASKRWWVFDNGSMIRFGHMQRELDKHNYDGPEFHRIAFDQVEQFTESQYSHMFSRLRRTTDFPLPCGMRSAANPTGAGWVKRRFISQEAMDTLKGYTAYDPSPPGLRFRSPCGAVFVPSRIADNPSLEVGEYIERLRSKLGPMLAARLANGDWTVVEGSIVDPAWLRYYTLRGDNLVPLTPDGELMIGAVPNTSADSGADTRAVGGNRQGGGGLIHERQCQRFATVDTAGTSRQKAAEDKGRSASWSVCAVWDYWPAAKQLFLRYVWRDRVEWNELRAAVRRVVVEWEVHTLLIENAHHGQPLASELKSVTSIRLVGPVIEGMKTARVGDVKGAKQERAINSGLMARLQEGNILLPDTKTVPNSTKWMPELEAELLGWTGRPDQTADQIDVLSYAADHVRKYYRRSAHMGGYIRV